MLTAKPNSRNRQFRVRRGRGAMLALAMACATLLCTIGVAYLLIGMMMGGAKELRHAVDAGTLATAREALNRPVADLIMNAPNGSSGQWCEPAFQDVAENDDDINLYNFNRLMAQNLLVELNYGAMSNEGTAGPDFGDSGPFSWPLSTGNGSRTHVRQLKMAVLNISERLGTKLQNPAEQFQQTFQRVVSANSVRMLGAPTSSVTPTLPWTYSYLNRQEPSNVYVENHQVPDNSPLQAADIPKTSVTISGTARQFIQGYQMFSSWTYVMGDPLADMVYFVPIRPLLKPNLVDEADFLANTSPPLPAWAGHGIPSPYAATFNALVPNAWSAGGRVQERVSSQPLAFTAYAAAEATDKGFPASIPYGFIHFHVSTPPLTPEFNLSDCINNPSLSEIRRRILQRIWEIDPDFSEGSLDALLSQVIFGASQTDGYIFKERGGPVRFVTDSDLPFWLRTTPLVKTWTPDGAALPPVDIENGPHTFRFQFTPCTGYNWQLAEIKVDPM